MEKALAGIDSLVAFTNTSGLQGRGTLVHISRSVAVFEVYNPFSLIQLSEVLQEISVMRGERVIYRGRGVVTSLVTTGLMVIASVTLIDSWSNLEHLEPGPALHNEISRFINDWEEGLKLSEGYQLAVNKFSDFLSGTSRWIEEAETAIVGNDSNPEKASRFRESIEKPVAEKLTELLNQFQTEANRIPDEESVLYKAFARRELHPYMLCAPFLWRSYYKPLGYAGDYEMVNMMLQESPSVGTTTYAKIFHDLTTSVKACIAHRNRVKILERQLAEEAERVTDEEQRIFTALSVACGPAIEAQRFIRNHEVASQCAIHLMDFNDETLQYTTRRVHEAMEQTGRKPAVKFIQKSIDDLLKNIHLESEGFLPSYDMIYCGGLFDYFPDNVCRNLLSLYYRWIRPGGLLVATNVHPNNPDIAMMEHLLEWYLIYRDEKHLASLAPKGTDAEVFADETGVNVFLTIRKPA